MPVPVPDFVGDLVRRYPCLVCRKRATVVKPGFCPVSGQAGVCPIAAKANARKAANAAAAEQREPLLTPEKDQAPAAAVVPAKGPEVSGAPAPLSTPLVMAPRPGDTDVSNVTARKSLLVLGQELLDRLDFEEAMKCFQGAIEENVNDWRGYYGKAEVQVTMGKHLMAFGTCRVGLEKCPASQELKDLQERARLQYKEAKNKPKAADAAALPACPGSVSATSGAPPVDHKPWDGRVTEWQERYNTKMMMLTIFREQWQRIEKEKAKHAKAAKAATSQYSQEQNLGLTIKGGHQPMARPENVSLPPDFRKKVGVVPAKQLEEYGCNNQRLLISLYGDIFDVSDRPDKYGADGPYYFFAGRDITWGLITGADTEENCNIFYDIFKMDQELMKQKMQCICSWIAFYETEYGEPVGRLVEFEDEAALPPPPSIGEACVVQ